MTTLGAIMTEPSLETLFGSCDLEVAVPDTSVDFPERQDQIDDWLAILQERQADRKHAFFGEMHPHTSVHI